MEPGELWWSTADDAWPIVLLGTGTALEIPAIQVVAPATEAQKRGYTLLTVTEALTADQIEGAGIEVPLDPVSPGVVRVALAGQNRIFCTWQLSVAPTDLLRPAGTLPPATLAALTTALRLAGIDQP